ncbi:MAG: DUF362 domain-containing protein [Proteobacteria bacterium]|nr:DUF362 domain-containing protein [Pseudomonadota bacterium]
MVTSDLCVEASNITPGEASQAKGAREQKNRGGSVGKEGNYMTRVVIADTTKGIRACLDEIFGVFGGIDKVIPKNGGRVYIKPNAVHFTPFAYTDIDVMDAMLGYLNDNGYNRISVMEGSTGGNFTRLVFKIVGYAKLCKKYGAEPLYLDEGKIVTVGLNDGTKIRVSKRLHDEIIIRGENFYIDMPKLKTHSMAVVTLGVKNQQGFPVAPDRMAAHSHGTLHKRLAALYAMTRPDFCIIEGVKATAHGHIPILSFNKELVLDINILIGGNDTLAVDVVGARTFGYSIDKVLHLSHCAKAGLGEGDIDKIEIKGIPLSRFDKKIPYTLLRKFNPDVRIVIGKKMACVEGCKGNTEAIQEMIYNDYNGRGGWSLIYGSGFEDADLANLPGEILIVGPCACSEIGAKLKSIYPGRKIHQVNEHNDLMNNTRLQLKLSGVPPLRLCPCSPLSAAFSLLQAKLHGLNATVPPLLG